MENLKHTKANGECNSWEVAHHYSKKDGHKIVVHAHPKRIALCYIENKEPLYPSIIESEANAKLIAAAPELLEALIKTQEWLKDNNLPSLNIIDNAINKATK